MQRYGVRKKQRGYSRCYGCGHYQFGILRIIVDQPKKAEAALKEQGFTVSLTKVIAIGIDDTPGGLHSAMLALDEAGVSVDYLYAFISRSEPWLLLSFG